MAFLGSNIASEVGLRLLLCPVGSNIVLRTACCSVGIVLPVYSTFKAIERKNENDQQKWLMYWAAYGSFSLVEVFTDKLISWFPMYYHVKFAFLVWLQLPTAEWSWRSHRLIEVSGEFGHGANQLYKNHLRPFLLRHHGRFDLLVGFAYGEMVRFYSRHQAGIGYAKTILLKIMGSAGIMPKAKSNRPGHPQIEDSSPTISDDDND